VPAEHVDVVAHGTRTRPDVPQTPVLTRIAGSFDAGYDLDFDALFAFGLTPLPDGIALMIEA
jgi:hypothetical protein